MGGGQCPTNEVTVPPKFKINYKEDGKKDKIQINNPPPHTHKINNYKCKKKKKRFMSHKMHIATLPGPHVF